MCARRAVRVTSVFSSAAASLRVRTDRDVCRAENCVRNTSGKRTQKIMHQDLFSDPFSSAFTYIKYIFSNFIHMFTFSNLFPSQLLVCTLTWLDVAIVTDDPSPASVYGQVAGVPLSLALSLQQLLFLPHLLPVPQKKHSMLQHKVPDDGRKYVNKDRYREFFLFVDQINYFNIQFNSKWERSQKHPHQGANVKAETEN